MSARLLFVTELDAGHGNLITPYRVCTGGRDVH